MYPGEDVLLEVGRVTIAGSRLDIQMGFLWHHLDRSKDVEKCRRASGSQQCSAIRRAADERLRGDMHADVLAAVEAAENARQARNEVVHQDWIIRSRAGMRPVSEIAAVPLADRAHYQEEWDRQSLPSQDWLRVPRDSIEVVQAQALDELKSVERALSVATDRVQELTFRVASSRECGMPEGYVHPREQEG